MIQRIVEPDTCKYSMDGITVDTESEYELCFDFEDDYGTNHHITATQLAVIKEAFHTVAWDLFVTAHNEYAEKHEEYSTYRIKMIHAICNNDSHYREARELVSEFSLLAIEDNGTFNTRQQMRDAWIAEYQNACFACNASYDIDALFALGSKWLYVQELTFYRDPR